MRKPTITLVLACGTNGQIGLDNKLPWNLPEDLAHFKELTTGQTVIMGRKTFESIGRPLPNRQNIVVSNKLGYLPGATIANDFTKALEKVNPGNIACIIGGISLWTEAIRLADNVIISMVDYNGPADVRMPEDFFEYLNEHYVMLQMKRKNGFMISEWIHKNVE